MSQGKSRKMAKMVLQRVRLLGVPPICIVSDWF